MATTRTKRAHYSRCARRLCGYARRCPLRHELGRGKLRSPAVKFPPVFAGGESRLRGVLTSSYCLVLAHIIFTFPRHRGCKRHVWKANRPGIDTWCVIPPGHSGSSGCYVPVAPSLVIRPPASDVLPSILSEPQISFTMIGNKTLGELPHLGGRRLPLLINCLE